MNINDLNARITSTFEKKEVVEEVRYDSDFSTPSRFTLNVNEDNVALIQTINIDEYKFQELYEDGSVYLITYNDFKRTNVGKIKHSVLKEALEKTTDDFLDVNLLLDK